MTLGHLVRSSAATVPGLVLLPSSVTPRPASSLFHPLLLLGRGLDQLRPLLERLQQR
jgi:hypothetical protein